MIPLDFEIQIVKLEAKINDLRHLSHAGDLNITEEVTCLQKKVNQLLSKTYSLLTPWQKVQVARHPERPHFLDYIQYLIQDFTPLAGDRNFAEDPAIIGGLGRFMGQSVMIMGHHKGHDTDSRLKHNFGMARPEGYRKSQRLMNLANHFSLPVITLIDTPGAHPGIDAEERGQAEAIARCIETCINLTVPLISVVTGEGMSGGAIAIAAANKVMMLEHAIYSVISPEGCASILWRTAEKRQDAAAVQRLTAQDLSKLGIIDKIIEEPLGGAHRSYPETMEAVRSALAESLKQLSNLSGDDLKSLRRNKFLRMGKKGL